MTKIQINTDVIKFNVTNKRLEDLKKNNPCFVVNNKDDLKAINKSITEVRNIRVAVEKKRKELKDDALKFGKKVDAEAKRIKDIIVDIEQPLKDSKQLYENEQIRIVEEKNRLEEERIAKIKEHIISIKNIPHQYHMSTADIIHKKLLALKGEDSFDYQEFTVNADNEKSEVIKALEGMHDKRLAFEKEQEDAEKLKKELEQQRIELKKEQEDAEGERRKLAKERLSMQRIKREQEAADLEKKRIEAEKQEAEELAKLEREAEEREAVERAKREKEEAEQRKRDDIARAEREKEEGERLAKALKEQEAAEAAKLSITCPHCKKTFKKEGTADA